jgi:NADH:ubiquinone oxidoreductase subunit 3 (subunit A)
MLIEAIVAFALIFISTFAIYTIGQRSAPKTAQTENEQMSYACGEKIIFKRLKVNVSLYKYLIYFVIFDSAVLLLSFASLAIAGINPFMLILYLSVILASGFVLLEGGKE